MKLRGQSNIDLFEQRYGLEQNSFICFEDVYNHMYMLEHLKSLIDKRLYKQEQEQLTDWLIKNGLKLKCDKHLGFNRINDWLKENNISMIITSKINNSRLDVNYFQKKYWIIKWEDNNDDTK